MSNLLILSKSDINRFLSKFIQGTPKECWEWKAGLSSRGYGKFSVRNNGNKKTIGTHRIAYFLYYKTQPRNNLVCHHCDNPKCVNPKHLFLGTHQDNRTDCVQKKRHAFGDRSGARLHPERLCRGDNSWTRKYPERLPRGDEHWTHKKPHLLARGIYSGRYTHPESNARGENNGSAKLNLKVVVKIRKQYASGKFTCRKLAKIYKVSKSLISAIIQRHIWRHI